MISEEALIPYQTSPLPEGPWVVFTPHPDDETFGMGGTLLLAMKKAMRVTLVVLTDGSMGCGEGEVTNIISIREKETREISKRLHLESVLFWRQPDRRLKVSRDLVDRVSELIRKVKPATVFFPSPMELHPDHRTASTLVWEGLRHCPTFLGNAYAYEISVQCPANRLVDITSVSDEKSALATLYRSQMAEKDYLISMLALNKTRAYTLPPEVHFAEAFFAYERIGETDLSFQTLNNLRPYWSEYTVFQTPLISVIVRTLNRPEMLKNALKSLAQQIHPEIEALIINDGGEDVSEIVHMFKGAISKLRYIPLHPNRGRSTAANVGLQEATGHYLMFLDDDDWLYPDHIAKLVNALEKNETQQVVYTGVECLSETTQGRWERVHAFNEPFDPVLLLIRNCIPIHSVLFNRKLLDGGCRFDENLSIYEDWDFWVQLSRRTGFRRVEGISAAYRIGGASGFGVSADRSLQSQSHRIFLEKWQHLWSYKELSGIVGYALQKLDFRFLEEKMASKQEEIDAVQVELEHVRQQIQSISQEEKGVNEGLRAKLDLAQNKANEWHQRCEDLESSRIWRYMKLVRSAGTMVKIANRRARATGKRWMHDARKSLKNWRQ